MSTIGAADQAAPAAGWDPWNHAFTDLARRAKTHGLRVHVVTALKLGQRRCLSHQLATVADRRTTMHLPASTIPAPTPVEAA